MAYALEGSIRLMRERAAAAREDLATCSDPDLRLYLTARANQADCEAGAMQQSVDSWRGKEIEAEVTRAERSWGIG